MYSDRAGRVPVIMTFFLLIFLSVGIVWIMVNEGVAAGPLAVVIVAGLFLVGAVLRDFRVGLYFALFLGTFIFYIDRLMPAIPIPLGVVYDGFAALVFVAALINGKDRGDWTLLKNPITAMFIVITVYQLLQFFNPNAVSHMGWVVSLRNHVSFLLFIVCLLALSTIRDVKRFTTVWLVLAAFIALYGISQEVFGLSGFEEAWLNSSPERVKLYLIWGKLRKFSILSDPSSFGLFMAFSSLSCLALAMGPFRTPYRIGLGILSFLMFLSMSYSGTRTAIAMMAVGITFFIVMTLRNRKTIIASIALVFIGGIILFGPFYGGTLNRIRSTFNPSEDPSMAVRNYKRLTLQNYVLSHPIGGGLGTTGKNGVKYSPGHYLAGGWDPDSGYLFTALEMGWIGLIIFQVFFFIVMLKGINNYFSLKDPLLKTLTLTYLVPFLALTVAHFTQDALFQKPVNLIVIVTYAMMVRLPSFEKKLFSVDLV